MSVDPFRAPDTAVQRATPARLRGARIVGFAIAIELARSTIGFVQGFATSYFCATWFGGDRLEANRVGRSIRVIVIELVVLGLYVLYAHRLESSRGAHVLTLFFVLESVDLATTLAARVATRVPLLDGGLVGDAGSLIAWPTATHAAIALTALALTEASRRLRASRARV